MAEQWKNYFSRSGEALTSVAVDIALGEEAPIDSKPWLLWVRVLFNSPRPDGLSSSEEAPVLFKIEDALVDQLRNNCNAIECGRTTSRAERVFYFYAEFTTDFAHGVRDAMAGFPEYRFEYGEQKDPSWSNYRSALFPSEEEFQLIGNGDVLGQLMNQGDTLIAEREVTHWIFFECSEDRTAYRNAAEALGYRIEEEYLTKGKEPYTLRISRTHAVTPDIIDGVVLELFRLGVCRG